LGHPIGDIFDMDSAGPHDFGSAHDHEYMKNIVLNKSLVNKCTWCTS